MAPTLLFDGAVGFDKSHERAHADDPEIANGERLDCAADTGSRGRVPIKWHLAARRRIAAAAGPESADSGPDDDPDEQTQDD